MSASTQFNALAHVDLCSGIGGFALGFEWAGLSKPVMFCDTEAWCRKILRKHWPDVPIEEDVKELANDPDGLIPDTDPRRTIITAGYPCQPFSVAGARRGTEDDRHIWPHILSIVQAKRPSWCVFENVYGHISLGLDEVLSDLEGQEYAARPFIVPACGVDAPHRRDRLWIIAKNVADSSGARPQRHMEQQAKQADAFIGCSEDVADAQSLHSDGGGEHSQQSKRQEPKLRNGGSSDDVADANGQRGRSGNPERQDAEAARQSSRRPRNNTRGVETWNPEPAVGRVANGIPSRVDRLRGLGNAIVPQIAMQIGKTIREVELQNECSNTV